MTLGQKCLCSWISTKPYGAAERGVFTMTGVITVYRFMGDRAFPIKKIELKDVPKADMLRALAVVREGLPPDHGASLSDPRGYSIRN